MKSNQLPKWVIKYIYVSFILIIVSVVLSFFGYKEVFVNDTPHWIMVASTALQYLGLMILVLLTGYIMGADYALKVLKEQKTEETT